MYHKRKPILLLICAIILVLCTLGCGSDKDEQKSQIQRNESEAIYDFVAVCQETYLLQSQLNKSTPFIDMYRTFRLARMNGMSIEDDVQNSKDAYIKRQARK